MGNGASNGIAAAIEKTSGPELQTALKDLPAESRQKLLDALDPMPTAAEIKEELAVYDKDNNGSFDKDEIKAFFTRPGNRNKYTALSDEEASDILETLIAFFDKNDDGKVSIDELAEAVAAKFDPCV